MLEILIMIGVVQKFAEVANSNGRNKYIWGTIGAVSYYGPVLLMSIVILPSLCRAGYLPFVTEDNVFVVSILANLASGILCCYLAYLLLKSLASRSATLLATEEG